MSPGAAEQLTFEARAAYLGYMNDSIKEQERAAKRTR